MEDHDLIMNLPSLIRLANLGENAVERQIVIGRVGGRSAGKSSTVWLDGAFASRDTHRQGVTNSPPIPLVSCAGQIRRTASHTAQ